MELPAEVAEILEELLAGVRAALGGNLVGLYLRGSLASGGFDPDTSDVDVLAVTERPVDEAEFAALARLHACLAALPNPFGDQIEIAYVARGAVRRFRAGESHPTLGRGEMLARSEHHCNWVLERWTVRECGVTLWGPEPRSLIDPVSADELSRAVRARLKDWAEWAQALDDPDWLAPRRAMAAYVVETMCRALHTLTGGELSTKRRAVEWAVETLPRPWRDLAGRSQGWRTDDTRDASLVPEVTGFVLWAASRSEAVEGWRQT